MYLLRLAIRPWKLAPMSQIFAGTAVGFLLLIAGFLFWMERGLNPVLARLQGEQVITAFIDSSIDSREESKVVDSIRVAVGAHAEQMGEARAEVKLVGTQQFLEEIKGHYPELSRELADLGDETNTVVPRYVQVSGMLGPSLLNEVKTISGVESAESSKDRYKHIIGAFLALRWVSKFLILGIALALLTGLVQLSRMNSFLHQEAFALLRLWGAGPWTLRMPGILSGVAVGLLGGTIALSGWIFSSAWLARQLRVLSPFLRELPMPTLTLGLVLLLAGAAIGVLAGALGTEARS
jgi:cell division protein FtsX